MTEKNIELLESIFENDTKNVTKYLNSLDEFDKQSKAFEKYLCSKAMTVSLPNFDEHKELLEKTKGVLKIAREMLKKEKRKTLRSLAYFSNSKLFEAVKEQVLDMKPNISVTIRFNKDFKTDEIKKIYSITSHILQKYQKFYSIHHKGLKAIGILEGTGKSAHIHLAIYNPKKTDVDIEDFYAIKTIAKLNVISSDVNVQSIDNVSGWANYILKYFNDSQRFFIF